MMTFGMMEEAVMDYKENRMKTFKKLEWTSENPEKMLLAKVKIFGDDYLGFSIVKNDSGELRLIDGQKKPDEDGFSTLVKSVEEGQREAQFLYEQYCSEIVLNICK